MNGDPEVTAVWFGPEARPLFGLLHRPAQLRGGVVLCPSIGVEAAHTAIAVRHLARELARRNLLVLRFDYPGTGQSAGTVLDDDAAEGWPESVVAAAELLRQEGAPWVAGIGLRFGAVLASNAARRAGFDALVLWHPIASGRSFVREQRALQAAWAPPRIPLPGPEVPGLSIPDAVYEAIRAMMLDPESVSSPRVHVVSDPIAAGHAQLEPLLARPDVDAATQSMTTIVDIDIEYHQASEPIDQLARWVDANAPGERVPRRPAPEAPVVVLKTAHGDVAESVVRLGEQRLFGIETSPRVADRDDPVVLFLSIGAETSIGPARQWVELSRDWSAARNARCVRLDLSGIGESEPRPGEPERILYSAAALADITEAAAAASPDDPSNVILVGACSSAYAALVVAPTLRPRAVVAINPWLERPAFGPQNEHSERRSSVVRAVGVLRSWVPRRWKEQPRWPALRAAAYDVLAPWFWRLPVAFGWAHSPAAVLDAVAAAGVPTLVLCGDEEAYAPLRLSPGSVRRLNDTGNSRFEVVPHLHHSLLDERSRATARPLVERFLESAVWHAISGANAAMPPDRKRGGPRPTAGCRAATGPSAQRKPHPHHERPTAEHANRSAEA